MVCREIVQCYHQIFHQFFNRDDFLFGIHTDIQCHLIVAAAAGMQAFADITDTADEDGFHVHVDILCFFVKCNLAGFDIGEDFL